MSNITKSNKMGMLAVVLAASLFVGTLAISAIGHDNAYAGGSKHHKKTDVKVKENGADQAIAQPQRSSQGAQCVSGSIMLFDCNNLGFQFGLNTGNEALGQQ